MLLSSDYIQGANDNRRPDLMFEAAGQGVRFVTEMKPARQIVFDMVERRSRRSKASSERSRDERRGRTSYDSWIRRAHGRQARRVRWRRPIAGTRYAARQDFAGTLTGDYVDHGDPPWRWYLMTNLTAKPEAYTEDSVWCEAGMLFVADDPVG
jgi:hypothetical protein